ncbi:MAG: phosphoadenylyl-sulfate reductase [Lentisphaeria bacterium]|nr:phosphoadenylyl-sulfate reductase [Lentisphaeria bacterium]
MSASIDTVNLDELNEAFDNATTDRVLSWCYERFSPEEVKLSTSFGAEGMVLLHMLVNRGAAPRVFTLDTGRNYQETYDVWQACEDRYGIHIEGYTPDPADVEDLYKNGGPNLFYASVENRKRCCYVRKVKPLKRALTDAKVWITGLRAAQNTNRAGLRVFSFDKACQVIKVCPLLHWHEVNVWDYIRANGVPYNKRHDRGYPTIGCAPCTRPVRPAEDPRAGRWWWETDDQRECGLHIENGKVIREKAPINFTI